MGDFRADIKIEFQMGSLKRQIEMSINWSPNDDGVDERVIEWFRTVGDEGRGRILDAIAASQEESARRETEERERVELARLKAKYEG